MVIWFVLIRYVAYYSSCCCCCSDKQRKRFVPSPLHAVRVYFFVYLSLLSVRTFAQLYHAWNQNSHRLHFVQTQNLYWLLFISILSWVRASILGCLSVCECVCVKWMMLIMCCVSHCMVCCLHFVRRYTQAPIIITTFFPSISYAYILLVNCVHVAFD